MHGTAPRPAAPGFSATVRELFLALGPQIHRAIAPACMPCEAADDVLRVLRACRAIELAMAGLYEALAEIHQRDPSMAALWRKTAREETNHAAQFSLLLEAIPETIKESALDAQALENLHQAVENTVEEYRLRSPSVREVASSVTSKRTRPQPCRVETMRDAVPVSPVHDRSARTCPAATGCGTQSRPTAS